MAHMYVTIGSEEQMKNRALANTKQLEAVIEEDNLKTSYRTFLEDYFFRLDASRLQGQQQKVYEDVKDLLEQTPSNRQTICLHNREKQETGYFSLDDAIEDTCAAYVFSSQVPGKDYELKSLNMYVLIWDAGGSNDLS